jgi:deoxyribonuclease V
MMRGKHDPDWRELVEGWKRRQEELRQRLRIEPLRPLPRFVAGADAAFSKDKQTVFAAAVVYDRQERRIVEVRHAVRAAEVPYVPGFLSFREGPAVLDALRALAQPFGAILFDGQGYAHPRRCGLATHMAIELDMPGVGVAKSRLIGTYDELPPAAGAFADLLVDEEVIGSVLRTQERIRPLYVSIGHRVDLGTARELVLACCTRYRLPEPTRLADIEVARLKRRAEGIAGE